MVTNIRQGNPDRGQLILVGAITLAFIILGVVVVFNGVLYTETLSSTATSQGASDATTIEAELASGVGGVVHHVNIRESGATDGTLADAIEGPDGYAERYRDGKMNSRPAIVGVSGVAITEPASVKTDEPISGIAGGPVDVNESVGHLEFDLESTDSGETVTVRQDGDELEITDENGGFEIYDGNNTCSTADVDDLRLDVVAGVSNAAVFGDCTLSIVDPSNSSDVIITADRGISGTFDIVVEGDSLPITDVSGDPGAWAVAVDVEYDSNDVSYEKRHTIDVYGDGS